MDGIDYGDRIIIPDNPLISDSVRDKGGQGGGNPYLGRRRPPKEPLAEETAEEAPAEPGKPKHLIDIKV